MLITQTLVKILSSPTPLNFDPPSSWRSIQPLLRGLSNHGPSSHVTLSFHTPTLSSSYPLFIHFYKRKLLFVWPFRYLQSLWSGFSLMWWSSSRYFNSPFLPDAIMLFEQPVFLLSLDLFIRHQTPQLQPKWLRAIFDYRYYRNFYILTKFYLAFFSRMYFPSPFHSPHGLENVITTQRATEQRV